MTALFVFGRRVDAETGYPPATEDGEVLFIESTAKAVLHARVVPIMRDNSGIKVRTEGHTDSVGADRYSQLLSLRRVEAVCDYLISQGIADTNLSIAGYDESNPIDSDGTKAGRANNRRVEFVIRQSKSVHARGPKPWLAVFLTEIFRISAKTINSILLATGKYSRLIL